MARSMDTMQKVIQDYFEAYFKYSRRRTLYNEDLTPKDMMASEVNENRWFTWKPIPGTLSDEDYYKVEQKFRVSFPRSFIEWHKKYYFLDSGCSLVDLPISNPKEPLLEIIDNLDYDFAKDLIALKLYPFASDGGDRGPWAFDAREERADNEYPIRVCDYDYDYDYNLDPELDGLSGIIFSSFSKLLECITYFMNNVNEIPDYEIILDFFKIDPEGAGKTGFDYWLNLSNYLREDSEE